MHFFGTLVGLYKTLLVHSKYGEAENPGFDKPQLGWGWWWWLVGGGGREK